MVYENFNKGNDCDCCENQYLCGIDGDCVACHRADENKECNFVPVHCEFCDSFAREELKCEKLGYYTASNSGAPCWEWNKERHEDCPFNPQN